MSPMDTTVSLPPSSDGSPEFVPAISGTILPAAGHSSSSRLIPDSPAVFPKQAELNGPQHVSTNQPNLSPPAYLEPDAIDPSAVIHSTSSTISDFASGCSLYVSTSSFENDMPVAGSAVSHAPSLSPPAHARTPPRIHTTAPGFSATPTSSLQSALEPVTPARSRANTIGSFAPSVMMNLATHQPSIDLFPSANKNSSLLAESMLHEIAHNAETAGQACRMLQPQRAHTLLEGLRNKLSVVSDLISSLTDVSLSDSKLGTPYGNETKVDYFSPPPSLPSSGDPVVSFPISSPLLPSLVGAEERRKRCASTLEEERPVKSLKAEPQDNTPLFTTPSASLPYHVNSLPQSPPPSRPASPPFTFTTGKQQPLPPNYNVYTGSGELFLSSPTQPTLPPHRTSWSESIVPTRHSHSLSASAIGGLGTPAGDAGIPRVPPYPGASAPVGRMTRSGSIGGAYGTPFPSFEYAKHFGGDTWPIAPSQDAFPVLPPLKRSGNSYDSSLPTTSHFARRGSHESHTRELYDEAPEDEDGDDDDSEESPPSNSHHLTSPDHTTSSDVPQEYRSEVDRIFFEYLNRICSNLDATDSKGEAIHQTLMAKKMQRLDESPDFRPFKFRIQAFTSAFLDELARQGYPEDKIPMKKVRNYLWRQPHILRFNEDGKKAKSKGNHIWNVEAKKVGDGRWEFRPFYRKLAGTPPSVAYCGLRWQWTPRVWDPQASWQNVPVHYSSPYLPSWLSWKDDTLSGIPPPDAQSCEVTVNATFNVDGQDGHLSHRFTLNIAPVASVESSSFGRSSIVHDMSGVNDLGMAGQRVSARTNPSGSDDTPARVVTVLQNVAQRVADETTHIQRSSPPSKQQDLGDLVKQQRVLEHTMNAYDKAMTGPTHSDTQRLARAAAQIVAEAAQTAVAPMAAAAGLIPTDAMAIQSASVSDMSDGVQGALAVAVKMAGHGSNEVDVMMTTQSLLAHSRRADARHNMVGNHIGGASLPNSQTLSVYPSALPI
ncbi:hypothetical protein IW261DRAFT_1675160 [Armillaria novae-zelandiae]|uniref:Uncharacterized protein n=1 Tax=Armillaria novae-zelandiae TaxID=153914 RepID=A0AA39PH34_9AGAR|nr:hypothetical protein IW261DRAFT_1675160 [Armillaria novae-zelandiae]